MEANGNSKYYITDDPSHVDYKRYVSKTMCDLWKKKF